MNLSELKSDLGSFSGVGAVIGSPVVALPVRQTPVNGFLQLHWVKEGLLRGVAYEGIQWTNVLEGLRNFNESCQGSRFGRNNGVSSFSQDIRIYLVKKH